MQPSRRSDRFFAVTDISRPLTAKLKLDLNLGVGYDVVGNGDRWVAKTIIGLGY